MGYCSRCGHELIEYFCEKCGTLERCFAMPNNSIYQNGLSFIKEKIIIDRYNAEAVAAEMLEHMKQSAELFNNTSEADVFFGRYDFLIELTDTLCKCAKFVRLNGEPPNKLAARLCSYEQRSASINGFLERLYSRLYNDVSSETYLYGRVDVAVEFIASLSKYTPMMYVCNIEKVNGLFRGLKILLESHVKRDCGYYDKYSEIVSIFKKEWLQAIYNEFVVIDIETTGLDKRFDRIVEFAAIKYEKGTESAVYHTLINPEVHIFDGVVAIHGITDEIVRDSPRIDDVMPEILCFLGDSILAGHNTNFDVGFIEVQARNCGFNPMWNYIDTISISKRLLKGLPDYKQGTVLRAIGYEQSVYHRALDDCRGCAQIVLLALNSLMD